MSPSPGGMFCRGSLASQTGLLLKLCLLWSGVFCPVRYLSAQDWPMAAHDAWRSGATEVTLRPPFVRKWFRLFPDEGLMAGVQPVVAGGRLFIGTLRGTVHAIDCETGADVWKRTLPGAVLHSCAVQEGRVFVPCADGHLYALSTEDGKLLWRYQTPHALWNSPAVFGGTVYFGGRDGCAYAVRAANGELVWRRELGAPILASPAVDPVRGRVFFAAENMRVFAFRLRDGEPIWGSEPLPGVTFRGYYPVIAPDGSVMITTAPLYSQEELQAVVEEAVREVFGDYASWRHSAEENARLREQNFRLLQDPETYRRQMALIREKLRQKPYFQTFFLLDGETGKPRALVPIVYAESMNGTGMPAVVTPEGKVIVKFQALLRSRYQHYSPFLNVGYLNTQTGDIEPLLDETRTYGWHDSLLLVHDEQCCLGVAGRTLINTHQDNVNAVDLVTREGYTLPFCRNIHEPEPGEALGIWAVLLRGQTLPPGKEWLLRGTAVYGGGSSIDVAVTVAGDSFYYLPTHELNAGCAVIAYRMGGQGTAGEKESLPKWELSQDEKEQLAVAPFDWDTLRTPRIARLVPECADLAAQATERIREQLPPRPQVDDGALNRIIWEVAVPASDLPGRLPEKGAQLQKELCRAVRELVAEDWAPFLFPAGKHPVESYRFFADPMETLLTLAWSYPYLDEQTQSDVRKWVQKHRQTGGILADLWSPRWPTAGGVPRTWYDTSKEPRLVLDDRHLEPLFRLYCLWLWAHHAADDTIAENVRVRLAELISQEPQAVDVDLGNSRIAGWIAAARWARQLRLAELEGQAVAKAHSAMRRRLEYEWNHPIDGVFLEARNGRWVCARWRNLTPEVARLLAECAGPVQAKLMERYVEYHRPTWWLAWNVELAWRNESPFSLPSMAAEIFAAQALILGVTPEKLAGRLDIPWCAADLFYIQKLVWALQAWQGVRWVGIQ